MSNSRIGSVGNEDVDSSAIPTELFEMDTTNKLLKLKDGWTHEGKFTNVEVTGSITATGLTTETALESTDEVILSRGTSFFKFLWSGIVSLVRDLVYPVGTVYTQFPGQDDPATLYGGVWDNISSSYPGGFFRAEGGNAAAFGGGRQGYLVGPHTHGLSISVAGNGNHQHEESIGVISLFGNSGITRSRGEYNTQRSGLTDLTNSAGWHGHDASGTAVSNGGVEARPDNYTIRIFKRRE